MFAFKQANGKAMRIIKTYSMFILFIIPIFLFYSLIFCDKSVKAGETGHEKNSMNFHINKTSGHFLPLDTIPLKAKQVIIGFYAVDIYDLSIKSNTYHMTAYIWLRWSGDIDPIKSLGFTNLVEDWSFTKKLILESPDILPDGSKYQLMRIEGRFFQPFDLRNYPLDKQKLELFLEHTTTPYNEIVYLPDPSDTGYDEGLLVPGWKIIGLDANSYIHDYGSNFNVGNSEVLKYSVIKFSFELERHINFFIWKLILPLMIVMMTNWLALILKPTMIEVRTAMPSTALLTTVFMQQAALDAIPECPTLVLIDKIYVISYIFIILTLLQIIWVNTHIDHNSPSSIARMVKIDKISFTIQIFCFIVLIAFLLLNL